MESKSFDRRLHQLAFISAICGASIGLVATVVCWFLSKSLATETLYSSLLTLAAAIAVWHSYTSKLR
jgi:hypothetical protein